MKTQFWSAMLFWFTALWHL